MKARLLAVTIPFALVLGGVAAQAQETCLDAACTSFALFDTMNDNSSAPSTKTQYGTWGVDLAGMDTSVKPGDDFFRYVSGKWATTTQIPADRTRFGSFDILRELSSDRVKTILDAYAADKSLASSGDEAKIAALYRTFMDESRAEKLGGKPLATLLDDVKKLKTREDVARMMGTASSSFAASFFSLGVSDDSRNPDVYALYLSQSGLGLPDREFYVRDNFKEQKARYQKYVADMLRLDGWKEPESSAAAVVAMESQIAEAHWTRAESRDRDKTYNPMTRAELEKAAPGFPWRTFFKSAGVESADRAIVRQNTALPKIAAIFASTPVDTLRAWEAFRIADNVAPLLSKKYADAEWEFRSKFLNGQLEQRPRWKRGVSAVEGAMGEAVGRAFVAKYFPAESKAKMEKLVADLRTAMRGRIERLEWMSPSTKERALEKLAKFNVKIGYPATWRDYSGLRVVEGDLVGNTLRAEQFDWKRDVSRIGQKVDKSEWGMTPQTVNAYYTSTKNEIVFPAAILQPPFFDPNADAAVNYGGIGAVIGHEITHGFDDQGRKSDGGGVLRDWWAPEDAKKFEAQATRLGAQYESYDFPQLPGLHITPKLTMGENIADLGGVLLALDAYRISLNGQPAPVLDGFTGEQRVFLGWAQVWRTLVRDDALRQLIVNDSHSPGMIRAFAPLRNVDAWYDAFGIKEGDKHYVKPEERVRIW